VKNGGNFVHTLTLTDIHSGWTECAALAVEWTRSRAYLKNDRAWVEQKNGAVVRALLAPAGVDVVSLNNLGPSTSTT